MSDPTLAEAFAALLAAEQGEAAPAGSAVPADVLVDRIAARVIERLADGPFQETVRRVVGEVAERQVREEIARIRRAAGDPPPPAPPAKIP